eukprot:6157103-Pyramimonas_sp.AAC.1
MKTRRLRPKVRSFQNLPTPRQPARMAEHLASISSSLRPEVWVLTHIQTEVACTSPAMGPY